MPEEYSIKTCNELKVRFDDAGLHRPVRVTRYDAGTELIYNVQSVENARKGKIRLVIEKFVGGGFAGQVYRVRILAIDIPDLSMGELAVGHVYAMKILIPPSGFSNFFRNVLYWIGFQGPFQLQVNPIAARSGALWQKFIRRGAKIIFQDERAVVDIYATFIDRNLGSCGELSEWVDGRTWRLEVDDRLDWLTQWRKGKKINKANLGSPEYREKYTFMHAFVALLHKMGGHEFARQYEWSTCKSQPNCLKRIDTDNISKTGLTAVDFRAGLALLPFLPMSPGDFKLIISGLGRFSLVQFDRGDVDALEQFMDAYPDNFSDMRGMLKELKATERIYRDSVPDITHNHVRLLYSKDLWSTMLTSVVIGWRVRNTIDDAHAFKLRNSKIFTILLVILGLIPFLGRSAQRLLGHGGWRKHYKMMLVSGDYLKRTITVKMAERVIIWHRAGRVNENDARGVSGSILRYLFHLPLSLAPVGIHKLLTNPEYAKEKLNYLLIRPIRLYFNAELREQWLRDMIADGRNNHIITKQDVDIILSQLDEPFIQKYLKSLAVHVCTLPVTQLVSVMTAVIYIIMHPEMPRAQAWGVGLAIIALFQVVPISPGSLVRGFYVLYLVIKERNFKDYNIAVFLGFFKYIGYLAFPIQMAYRYPVLARFMAGHWARESVHIVPVFGESGALLEHWVYCLFYNWPLTFRRRIKSRLEVRRSMKVRYWHLGICAIGVAGIFGLAEFIYHTHFGQVPNLKDIWWMTLLVPLTCGAVATLGFGGAGMGKRLVGTACCGAAAAICYTAVSVVQNLSGAISVGEIIAACVWRIFLFSILAVIGAILSELKMVDPALKRC